MKFWKLDNNRITFAFRCEIIKKPSNEYTAIGYDVEDELIISESDMFEDGSARKFVGHGDYAFFNKDEIKVKQVIRTTVVTEIIDEQEKINEYFKINKNHGL